MQSLGLVLRRLAALSAFIWCLLASPFTEAQGPTAADAKDDALVWTIWAQLGDAAKQCEDEVTARNYLETAGMVVSDSTKGRLFAEVVESMAIDHPVCFLNAASAMRPATMKTMVKHFLAKPQHHSKREIEASLSKYWTERRYNDVRQSYVESRR